MPWWGWMLVGGLIGAGILGFIIVIKFVQAGKDLNW